MSNLPSRWPFGVVFACGVLFLWGFLIRIPYGMLMADGLLTTLPLVLAFLFFQKHFISGITTGAIKQ